VFVTHSCSCTRPCGCHSQASHHSATGTECSDPMNTGTHQTDTATFLETEMHDMEPGICAIFV
jgi:hypothetical protein